jgi:hypothetical protein
MHWWCWFQSSWRLLAIACTAQMNPGDLATLQVLSLRNRVQFPSWCSLCLVVSCMTERLLHPSTWPKSAHLSYLYLLEKEKCNCTSVQIMFFSVSGTTYCCAFFCASSSPFWTLVATSYPFQYRKLIGMLSLTKGPMWFVNLTALSCGANGMPSSETYVMMKRLASFLFGPRIPRGSLLLDDGS